MAAIYNKQKTDIGDLAFKHGLHEFDLSITESEFKKLSAELNKKSKG